MKTKQIRSLVITTLSIVITIAAAQLLKDDLSFLRVEFLQHGKGYAQHFINSFIN